MKKYRAELCVHPFYKIKIIEKSKYFYIIVLIISKEIKMNNNFKKIGSSIIISYAIYVLLVNIILNIFNISVGNYFSIIYIIIFLIILFLFYKNILKVSLKKVLISAYIPVLHFTYYFIDSLFSFLNFMIKDYKENYNEVYNYLDIIKLLFNEYGIVNFVFNRFTIVLIILIIIHILLIKNIIKKDINQKSD